MNRTMRLLGALAFAGLGMFGAPSPAAEMTFQLINDTERELNLKLFSRGESRQEWPAKTKAFSIRPDSAVQQVKIACEEGEQICWGAWMKVQSVSGEIAGAGGHRATRNAKYSAGAGERGLRTCARCCHVCKEGALTPVTALRDPNPAAK